MTSRVRTFWDDGEIVELMGVIALFGFLNRWNDGMGTTIETGARAAGEKLPPEARWSVGKHGWQNVQNAGSNREQRTGQD